jgi:hypothetical protein
VYGFPVSDSSLPIKVSFSFYPADLRALNERKAGLMKAGLPVRGATVLRALIHLTPPPEMFAHAVLMAQAYKRKAGPREEDNVADHPTVDLPREHVRKLDEVVAELAEKGITANRAFVVRAILRAAPDSATLVPAVKKFLAEFPSRPRGWAALKARKRGKR